MLVTQSYLGDQPYKKIVEDEHARLFCYGRDPADLLISRRNLASATAVEGWSDQVCLAESASLGSADPNLNSEAGQFMDRN